MYVGGYEENTRMIDDEGNACPCTDLHSIIDDQTWQFSVETLLFHEDAGDPSSPRVGPGSVLTRVPVRLGEAVRNLGNLALTKPKTMLDEPDESPASTIPRFGTSVVKG